MFSMRFASLCIFALLVASCSGYKLYGMAFEEMGGGFKVNAVYINQSSGKLDKIGEVAQVQIASEAETGHGMAAYDLKNHHIYTVDTTDSIIWAYDIKKAEILPTISDISATYEPLQLFWSYNLDCLLILQLSNNPSENQEYTLVSWKKNFGFTYLSIETADMLSYEEFQAYSWNDDEMAFSWISGNLTEDSGLALTLHNINLNTSKTNTMSYMIDKHPNGQFFIGILKMGYSTNRTAWYTVSRYANENFTTTELYMTKFLSSGKAINTPVNLTAAYSSWSPWLIDWSPHENSFYMFLGDEEENYVVCHVDAESAQLKTPCNPINATLDKYSPFPALISMVSNQDPWD